MAEIVLKKARIKVGTSGSPTTTLTDYVTGVTIDYKAEVQDKTAMGNDSRRRIAGLKDWSATINFNQNYASTDVEKFFWGLVGADSSNCWIQIKPTSSTAPRYAGRSVLEGFTPIGGNVGDLATFSVTFQGDGDLTRSSATA